MNSSNSIVMLSAAKHLSAQRERPFAAAQGDMEEGNGVTLAFQVDVY